MYNYRIAADQWWPFARACRSMYLTEHPLAKMADSIAAEKITVENFAQVIDGLKKIDLFSDLQMFCDGDTLILRPLERGWFFYNTRERWHARFGLQDVFYDDRSDIPPDRLGNRVVFERCDEKIVSGEYLTFSLINETDVEKMVLDKLMGDTAATT